MRCLRFGDVPGLVVPPAHPRGEISGQHATDTTEMTGENAFMNHL
jgi:hypothetical protein